MSGLDHLTAKILDDSKTKAEEIINVAKAEAARVIAGQTQTASAESEKIVMEARIEAAHTAEQLVQAKTLSVRDESLAAKRKMLDTVFAEALERLNDMPKEAYWKYLFDCLSKLDLDGEEIILPQKYGVTSINELNEKLIKAGKKGNLTLCADKSRVIEGGFVLLRKGVEQNNTFEALISYYRNELESEVLKTLYA